MKYYTYIHTSKTTGKVFYVGKGSADRLKVTRDRNSNWKNIANSEGWDATVVSYWHSEEEAFEHERFLIFCFRDMGFNLVNIHPGGSFFVGIQPSRGVICTSHNVSFTSCTEAASWLNGLGSKMNRSSVSMLCKTGKVSNGYSFAYADGTPYIVDNTPKIYRVPVGKSNTNEPHISWHEERNYFTVYFAREKIRKYFSPGIYGTKEIAWNEALKFKYSIEPSIYNDILNKSDHFPLIGRF